MTKRWAAAVFVAIAATALGGAGAQARWGRERADEGETVRSSVVIPDEEAQIARLATVPIEDAARAARGAAAGTVIAAELEDEDGSLVWSVEIVTETEAREVLIDPGNGNVLSNRPADGEADDEDDDEDDDEEEKDGDERDERCGRRGRRCR